MFSICSTKKLLKCRHFIDWSGRHEDSYGRKGQWETPQEQSDEEAPRPPVESEVPEAEITETLKFNLYRQKFIFQRRIIMENNKKDQNNSVEQNKKVEQGKDISAQRDPEKPKHTSTKEQ